VSGVLSPEAEGIMIARRTLRELFFSDNSLVGSRIKLADMSVKTDSQRRNYISAVSKWLSTITINGDEGPAGNLLWATSTKRTQAVLELVAGKIIAAVSTTQDNAPLRMFAC
jgi:hypothetical protein